MIQAGIFTNVCMGVVYIVLKEWSLNKGAVNLQVSYLILELYLVFFWLNIQLFFYFILKLPEILVEFTVLNRGAGNRQDTYRLSMKQLSLVLHT